MLIFEGIENSDTTDSNTENVFPQNDLSTRLKETFEKYRFEVEIHRGLKDHEIANTCDTCTYLLNSKNKYLRTIFSVLFIKILICFVTFQVSLK